jgi:hypothetical protein
VQLATRVTRHRRAALSACIDLIGQNTVSE